MCSGAIGHQSPRVPLIGAGLIITFVVFLALDGRMDQGRDLFPVITETSEVRHLQFLDQTDGSVLIKDAGSGGLITVLEPGTDHFVRAVFSGLTFVRKRSDVPLDAPFRIARVDDGQLVLDDPSTGEMLVLRAYGPSNSALFTRFIDTPEEAT